MRPQVGSGYCLFRWRRCWSTCVGHGLHAGEAELAKDAGADEVILYTETDFEAEVKRLTDGRGVDVVYDSVAKTTFDKSLNCLRPRGYLVLFGQSSGPVPPFDLSRLSRGSMFITRPGLGHHAADREELMGRAGDLFEWIGFWRVDAAYRPDVSAPRCCRCTPCVRGQTDNG